MGKFDAAKMNGAQDEKFKNAYNYLIDLLATGYVIESMIDGHRVRISIDTKNGLTITRDGVQLLGLDTVTGRVSVLGTASAEAAEALSGLIDALDDAAVKLGVTYAGAAMSALSGFTSTAVIDGQTVVVNMSSAAGGLSITVDGVQVGGLFLVDGVPSLFAGTLANVIDSPVFAKIGDIEVGGTSHNGLVIYQKVDDVDTAMLGLLFDADGGVSLGDATWRRFDAAASASIIRDQNGVSRQIFADGYTAIKDESDTVVFQVSGGYVSINRGTGLGTLIMTSGSYITVKDSEGHERIVINPSDFSIKDQMYNRYYWDASVNEFRDSIGTTRLGFYNDSRACISFYGTDGAEKAGVDNGGLYSMTGGKHYV